MALTRGDAQITWSSSSSVTLSSSTQTDSDAYAFDATDVSAVLQISADNQGTPASGDTLAVYLKMTTGDILGDSGDDYDTNEHAILLGRLDTYSTNTPGEDPARKSFPIDFAIGAKAVKVSVIGAQAATRNIVVRARIAYQRAA